MIVPSEAAQYSAALNADCKTHMALSGTATSCAANLASLSTSLLDLQSIAEMVLPLDLTAEPMADMFGGDDAGGDY